MMSGSEEKVKELFAGILTIGNEILDGHVLDTNSNWIQIRLGLLSVPIVRLVCIRDDYDEIERGLAFLKEKCNLIITSGGLGPTHDDLTLDAIGKTLGRNMVKDKEALEMVRRQYKILSQRGIVHHPDLTEPRRKMAIIPEGAIPLDNTVGGAPGVRIEDGETTIFCLPGVPGELKDIFTSSVEPWIRSRPHTQYYERIIQFPMRDESEFSPIIDRVMAKIPQVYIKSMPQQYGTSKVLKVWISARGRDIEELKELVSEAIEHMSNETGLVPEEADETR